MGHRQYKHLSIRVPWHDNKWDGTVCRAPSNNAYCLVLPRIHEDKDEKWEDKKGVAGKHWAALSKRRPPCEAESAAFMNYQEWSRTFTHPYQDIPKAEHGHLLPTTFRVPPFSTYAVPFWWMLRRNQKKIQESFPEMLPPDEKPPFKTPWVYNPKRQETLLELFFNKGIQEGKSLVFFYCKNGTPVNENFPRLIVGVGIIVKDHGIQRYDVIKGYRYPMWDRLISHSIRPLGTKGEENGILLPYHEYLEPTGDPEEDNRRLKLLQEITVAVDAQNVREFSYASEHVSHDTALKLLTKILDAIRAIRGHGIVPGPWARREDWVNQRIAELWQARGAFPGLGSVLEAFGVRHGTALSYDLVALGMIGENEDPWPIVDKLFRGEISPPKEVYAGDLEALGSTWRSLPKERKELLTLLSRFSLTPNQAKRWYSREERAKFGIKISDLEIISNPYVIAELDETDGMEPAVSVSVIDMGLLPDEIVAAKYPVPKTSRIESYLDKRRVRAAVCHVLKKAAYENGDTLLSETEVIHALEKLPISHPCAVTSDWFAANKVFLEDRIKRFELENGTALQLNLMNYIEDRLEKILISRTLKPLPKLDADWRNLLINTIEENSGAKFDETNLRYKEALEDQVKALQRLTSTKLSVLIGPAGTGKTSVMGALLRCKEMMMEGVLLLAPTGKARVRLSRMAGIDAFTIAQFLTRQDRYDWQRLRPLFDGDSKYRAERTVVIDECSMVTVEDLFAVLQALDLSHVKRIILVGDPKQLPPIGPGRPFADLCAYLDPDSEEKKKDPKRMKASEALAKLTVIVRHTAEGPSDVLQLAAWYTGEEVDPNADQIFEKLSRPESLNDLDIVRWKTPEELQSLLLKSLVKELGLSSVKDLDGFNVALGFRRYNGCWSYPLDTPDGAENFQILSPVKNPAWGSIRINRFIQETYRANEVQRARKGKAMSLGGQQIVRHDKIIQSVNERRDGYDHEYGEQDKYLIANGEIGVVAYTKYGYMNTVFAGRPHVTIGYSKRDFHEGEGSLELAYAITVHKAQGSEFEKVFVVIPEKCRPLSRELLYTALTRSRGRLVLLVQGDNPSWLFNLSNATYSETAKRNGNLFFGSMRRAPVDIPYADHLIHRTEKEGLYVRSKSEVIIANMVYREGIEFEYERLFVGEVVPGTRLPDFTFIDAGGDLILWEHLGMLHRESYRRSWEEKKKFYEANGYIEGANLFTTRDDERGAIDSMEIKQVIDRIRDLL